MRCGNPPILFLGVFTMISLTIAGNEEQTLLYERGAPQTEFAAAEIQMALEAKGDSCVRKGLSELPNAAGKTCLVLAASVDESRRMAEALKVAPLSSSSPQSYAIRQKTAGSKSVFVVLGADSVGAMYGGLDLAEAIRLETLSEIRDTDHTPYIAKRGIKFNVPLDARNPSYSDAGDAAQHNIPEMWSVEFWREFLDEMARDRYNVLTLWNLHPFPSMVKVPEYPEVALNDVMRTTIPFHKTPEHSPTEMWSRPEVMDNLEVVKKMTIDEKIKFWRDVMQYAHDRGVEVYIFTWNIFAWGAIGKHGITDERTNPITIDYFRKSVRELILTYPLLAGIGITAGEHMGKDESPSKEQWLWRAYGEGVREAKKIQPDRQVRMIHRYHQTALDEILAEWKDYPGTLDLSYKYAVAHMYSSPAPPFAKPELARLPSNMRMWMTVRNDDIYSFRWGDPEYARAFIRNLPGPDKLAGYYMGPDGYIWGREFIDKEPETPRQLVMKKQWLSFMLWGRLSYDPALPDSLFQKTLAARFPEANAAQLLAASVEASKIIPLATRFYWRDIDIRWFPEACIAHSKHGGFQTVEAFMRGKTMEASGIMNIREYAAARLAGKPMPGVTPLQVAEELKGHAKAAIDIVSKMNPGANKELRLTLGDYRAMALLGDYYAEKILGATDLALFDATGETEQKNSAVKHLEAALEYWKQYAAIATRQYAPQILTRIGYCDLNALIANVQQDARTAKEWKPGQIEGRNQ